MSYDDMRPIFEAKFNSNVAFLLKTKEQIEEDDNRALQKLNKTLAERAAKRRKLDEEKPDIHAQIWKNKKTVHGPAKVKGWKLLESCGVQIITFTSTHLILLVERKYPLIRLTLDQMLNDVRLEVEEESEVSLDLLSDIEFDEEVPPVVKIRAQDEGQARPNPGVQIEGHARSNPGDVAEPQPQSSHVFHAGPNLKHMDLEAYQLKKTQSK
nr:hypothetical protein [Tanacetum cinerariifolium]